MSEVNETTEMWRGYRAMRAEKRSQNRESSAQILERHEVTFLTRNSGAHLIITEPTRIDFWPGTGLFIVSKTGTRGRGVQALLKEVSRHETPRL